MKVWKGPCTLRPLNWDDPYAVSDGGLPANLAAVAEEARAVRAEQRRNRVQEDSEVRAMQAILRDDFGQNWPRAIDRIAVRAGIT